MEEVNQLPKTEKSLEKWMKDNCYNFFGFSIGGNHIWEGFGIDKREGKYIWYYTERGDKRDLNVFESEAEIIEFAYNQIKNDKWAKTHVVGFTENKSKSEELATILVEMDIEFFKDEIPYFGIDRPVYRTFVLGCDEVKTRRLKEKYIMKK